MAIRVRTFSSVQAWDLTDRITGLQYSSVNPGGDEQCSFAITRSWAFTAPEIQQGNRCEIWDGLACLWRGRIDQNDRRVEESQKIGVVALGSGVALKDGILREVYVDSDLTHWGPTAAQYKLAYANANFNFVDGAVSPDDTTGAPSLQLKATSPWGATGLPISGALYDANGVAIGSIYWSWKKTASVVHTDANWTWLVHAGTDDQFGTADSTGDISTSAGPAQGTLTTTGGNKVYATPLFYYAAAVAADNVDYSLYWPCMAVYGTHGLTKQGSESATTCKGFFASQIIYDVADDCAGITPRRIDTTSVVITQAEYRDGAAHEQVINDMDAFHLWDWGTWGPDSPLDLSTDGLFDYKAPEPTVAHWRLKRDQCDDIQLSTELSSLFNQVEVRYQDPSGASQYVTRTATVKALDDAGLTRKTTLDGGTLTSAGAQTLGDVFLALTGQTTPARGSIAISQPVQHYQRGRVPPWHIRADGANVLLSDVMTSRDVLALDSTADRASLFPVRRVTVDASGDTPKVSLEVDQTIDLLSTLQAQLQAAAQQAL